MIKEHKCPYCDEVLPDDEGLHRHIFSLHTGILEKQSVENAVHFHRDELKRIAEGERARYGGKKPTEFFAELEEMKPDLVIDVRDYPSRPGAAPTRRQT